MVGNGFPDLVIGHRKTNYLVELKDGALTASRRRLTPDEEEWHTLWRGDVRVIETIEQALAMIGVQTK